MVDVSIDSLISMARKYIENRGVDKDKSGTINNTTELNMLLAGTGASSIEDLTTADIHKKVVERDTEKVFTTFMATENHEQAKKNIELLSDSIVTISKTYDNLLAGFDTISKLMQVSAAHLDDLKNTFRQGDFGQEAVDKVVDKLENFSIVLMQTIKELDRIGEDYCNTTGQEFSPILQKGKFLRTAYARIQEQIEKVKSGSVPMEQVMNEIDEGIVQIVAALKDTVELRYQYEKQKKQDINFCEDLLERQMKFDSDNNNRADNQAMSKELLSILISETSPMTRNLVIKRAEVAYSPENDPTTTGINQNSAASNVKRSSYKTPTEIYTLRGKSVIVSDYSGKTLRTETLDPSVHKGFYE